MNHRERNDLDRHITGNGGEDQYGGDEGGHWPANIAEMMGGRNVLTVCLDIIGGVRGARDMTLSDCCQWAEVVQWYLDNWRPSDCPFDECVFRMLNVSRNKAAEWCDREANRGADE